MTALDRKMSRIPPTPGAADVPMPSGCGGSFMSDASPPASQQFGSFHCDYSTYPGPSSCDDDAPNKNGSGSFGGETAPPQQYYPSYHSELDFAGFHSELEAVRRQPYATFPAEMPSDEKTLQYASFHSEPAAELELDPMLLRSAGANAPVLAQLRSRVATRRDLGHRRERHVSWHSLVNENPHAPLPTTSDRMRRVMEGSTVMDDLSSSCGHDAMDMGRTASLRSQSTCLGDNGRDGLDMYPSMASMLSGTLEEDHGYAYDCTPPGSFSAVRSSSHLRFTRPDLVRDAPAVADQAEAFVTNSFSGSGDGDHGYAYDCSPPGSFSAMGDRADFGASRSSNPRFAKAADGGFDAPAAAEQAEAFLTKSFSESYEEDFMLRHQHRHHLPDEGIIGREHTNAAHTTRTFIRRGLTSRASRQEGAATKAAWQQQAVVAARQAEVEAEAARQFVELPVESPYAPAPMEQRLETVADLARGRQSMVNDMQREEMQPLDAAFFPQHKLQPEMLEALSRHKMQPERYHELHQPQQHDSRGQLQMQPERYHELHQPQQHDSRGQLQMQPERYHELHQPQQHYSRGQLQGEVLQHLSREQLLRHQLARETAQRHQLPQQQPAWHEPLVPLPHAFEGRSQHCTRAHDMMPPSKEDILHSWIWDTFCKQQEKRPAPAPLPMSTHPEESRAPKSADEMRLLRQQRHAEFLQQHLHLQRQQASLRSSEAASMQRQQQQHHSQRQQCGAFFAQHQQDDHRHADYEKYQEYNEDYEEERPEAEEPEPVPVAVGLVKRPAQPQQVSSVPPPRSKRSLHTNWDQVRTLMVRNIPAKYTQELLLLEWPHKDSYDFLYLPMKAEPNRNSTFAFVNFMSTKAAHAFYLRWHGQRLEQHKGKKALDISAAVVQGLAGNIAQVSSNKTYRIRTPQFQPVVFENNQRMLLLDYLTRNSLVGK
eukprot:TRINITY_DN6520_c0_g1_i1.p1 TRINITY_DN6520_c0_g1~~TRINITY_DN6520_c0_g1_i1.p1  ORF type:complete len:937 (+),score=237.76 TRINITY_DN6520_c0_g1_i1:94-2904(+)